MFYKIKLSNETIGQFTTRLQIELLNFNTIIDVLWCFYCFLGYLTTLFSDLDYIASNEGVISEC
jgi:hypothetical protein